MAVPTPLFTTNDMSTGFTEVGSPTYVDDQHSLGSAFEGDNIDNSINRASVITSSDTAMSSAIWFRISTVPKAGYLVAQATGAGDANTDFDLIINTDGTLQVVGFDSAVKFTFSTTSLGYDDGTWTHCLFTIAPGDVNIYINGVEVTYGVQDTNGSGGFSGFAHDGPLIYGDSGAQTGTHTNNAILSRPRAWNSVLSAAQALEEFNAEVAAVFVQTPDFTSDDLGDTGTWAHNGSALSHLTNDLHNPLTAIAFDGVDDWVTASPILQTGDIDFSVSGWFKHFDGVATTQMMFNQWTFNAVGSLQISMFDSTGSALIACEVGGFNNTAITRSQSAATVNPDDGIWHHVMFTRVGIGLDTDVNIYLDGVETPYFLNEENRHFNGGSVAVSAAVAAESFYLANRPVFFTSQYEGSISRPRFWRTTALSEHQALLEFNNEVALQSATPLTTLSSDDLSDTGTWTASGDPVFVTNPWSTSTTAVDLDGFGDQLSAGIEISVGTPRASGAVWLQRPAIQSRTEFWGSQEAGSSDAGIKLGWFVNTLIVEALDPFGPGRNSVQSTIAETEVPIGEYFHFAWTVEALGSGNADVNIYINGVEASYQNQDAVSNNGFNTFTSTANFVLGFAVGENRFTGQMARPRIWDCIVLTPAQVLTEYTNEVNLQLLTDVIEEGTETRLNNWSIYDPGLQRVSTLIEPFNLGTTLANAGISGQTLTSGQVTRLNDWGGTDPGLSIAGDSIAPFLFGDILNEAMGTPPFTTQLSEKQIDDLNDWELNDPALKEVETPEEPFNFGDTLNLLLTRTV
ncbi:MAG: LamG-like jellyroll fold domain-containing protein [Nitrosomonadaceae bacterium]